MFQPTNSSITIARDGDTPVIVELLNRAYRGESSRQGWTTEAHLIAGDARTDETHLNEVMKKRGSVILKYTDSTGEIVGCVNLQQHDDRIYLGMLSVSPLRQNSGIGKSLLTAAEEFAVYTGAIAIYMTVISARSELIDWYRRHGYILTGETIPFPEDNLTGRHLQVLEFSVLQKNIISH